MSEPPRNDVQSVTARSLVQRNVVLGVVLLLVAAAGAAIGAPILVAPALVVASFAFWSARLASRSSEEAARLGRISQRYLAGDDAGAWAEIDALEASSPLPYIRRIASLQRAMVAFHRGDLDAVVHHAAAATAGKPRWVSKVYERRAITEARSFTVLANALRGAPRDAELEAAVRSDPEVTANAMARLALAELLRLDRAGDVTSLERAMRTHRRLVLGALSQRERALYRGLQRKLTRRAPGVYRQAASREDGASSEDASWADRVAPDLAPFLHVSGGSGASGTAAQPSAAAPTRLESIARRRGGARRVLVLVGVGAMAVTVGTWATLSRPDVARGAPPTPELILAAPAAFLAFTVAFVVWSQLRAKKARLMVAREARRAANGEPIDVTGLTRIAEGQFPLAGAEAAHLRAREADERGDFANSVVLATEGMGLAQANPQARFLSAGALFPKLLAQRAAALAALGRADEALADLARLEASFPSYALLPCARHAVRALMAAHAGDVEALAKLAQAARSFPVLDHRIELLGDLARAAVSPESVGAAEVARIRAELDDAELRRWVTSIRADLTERFQRAAADTTEADEAAEAEAMASDSARASTVDRLRS